MNNNYVIINGRKKIPLFQLFDIPIVTRGKAIKLRTNVATVMIFDHKEIPRINLSILGKKIPMALIMFGYYGYKELGKRFNNFKKVDEKDNSLYGKLLIDLKEYYIESKGMTQDDFITEIGRYYSNFNYKVKGEDLIYALDLMLQTDIMTKEFFKKDSILEELIYVMQNLDDYDDTDFANKRIRCFEYIVLQDIAKAVFDLCLSNRTARQPKFNINSSQILSKCNISDIVQFDFSYSPIDQLTKLSRTSLVGPGGFSRKNVPQHLRDITPSMFGRVCPVDTPDRDNCGVLQNLVPNVNLDKNLKFDKKTEEFPISIPVSMVPFLEHDDQTRLQMASSQMRQSILLSEFDKPLVRSGCEGLYMEYTSFIAKAKKDGEVVFVDTSHLVVVYNDKTVDMFDIGVKYVYTDNIDIKRVYVSQGDKFRAGDILAESDFSSNGEMNIGRNLLTAVMVYYGHNYEDGIVISDRLVEEGTFTSHHGKDMSFTLPPNKVLISLDDNNYLPLPDPSINDEDNKYVKMSTGDTYAKIKEIPYTVTDYNVIFNSVQDLRVKRNMVITEVNIYANEWNQDIPEYKEWIEKKIESQVKEEEKLQNVVKEHLDKDQAMMLIRDRGLDKFSHTGKYKFKGEKINGVQFEIKAVFPRPIRIGDKIGNRHGNKGVISKIVPHEKMPQLEDGRHADICINPLGIISRMNIGQLYELHFAMSIVDLKARLLEMLRADVPQENMKTYLLDYVEIIDNTKDKWYIGQYREQIKTKKIDEKFIESITFIQPPFESMDMDKIEAALKHTLTEFEYNVYDPVSKQEVLNKVAVGYMYFFRMVHIAESRATARGIGAYSKRTLQPLAGRKNNGGQRCGEMETACLIAHDATKNLSEFFTTKSDCIDLKNRYIRELIDSDISQKPEDDNTIPESVKLLDAYMTVIGVDQDDAVIEAAEEKKPDVNIEKQETQDRSTKVRVAKKTNSA